MPHIVPAGQPVAAATARLQRGCQFDRGNSDRRRPPQPSGNQGAGSVGEEADRLEEVLDEDGFEDVELWER